MTCGLVGLAVLTLTHMPTTPLASWTIVPGGYTPRQRMNTCSSLGSKRLRILANISDSASCGVSDSAGLRGLHNSS